MQLLNSIQVLENIFKNYFLKNTMTNNYMLKEEHIKYVNAGVLYYDLDESNVFLYLKKDGFWRLYYFINDVKKIFKFKEGEIFVLELLYRGSKNFPLEHCNYFENLGFSSHFNRDLYFLKNIDLEKQVMSGISIIKNAESEDEIKFVKLLIDSYLDLYTGDNLSYESIKNYATGNNIYVSYTDNSLSGFLHSDYKNNVFWLSHIVVHPSFRGNGIASDLLKYYINQGINANCNQFQLWVVHDNEPAINLYKKFKFSYLNKSTFSMLKKPNG